MLEELIGPEADAEEFWARAECNLRGGALRLMFVADVIPVELAAVIEFLNTRMHDTDVYGVEVRRYGDADTAECFVPRLVGATAAGPGRRYQGPLEDRLRSAGDDVVTVAERLRLLGEETSLAAVSAANSLRLRDRLGTVVLVYPTYRTVEFPLDFLWRAGQDAEIAEVRTVLQQIAGTARPVSAKAPNLDCSRALDTGTRWSAFSGALPECERKPRRSPQPTRPWAHAFHLERPDGHEQSAWSPADTGSPSLPIH